jgi:hypothetical protein
MRKIPLAIGAGSIIITSGLVFAGPLPIPNVFVPDTTISSSQMNENFNALATAMGDGNTGLTQEVASNTAAIGDQNSGLTQQVNKNATDIQAILQESCPSDMGMVGPICVDIYEASVVDKDGNSVPNNNIPCSDNANDCSKKVFDDAQAAFVDNPNAIFAKSVPNATAAQGYTWFQAQQACANSGKRLLTNAEWQMAAAGTDSAKCTVSGVPGPTGASAACISNWGVRDMVGNVHEWVADWLQGNTDPYAAASSATSGSSYGDSAMVGTNPATVGQTGGSDFPAAIYRGSKAGGVNPGVFAFFANAAPSETTNIGFRCAK